MLRTLAGRSESHGSRQLVMYDSTVTAAGASRGRSAAPGLRSEQRRAYPALLAADIQEGVLWCDSERNPADVPSRSGGKQNLPVGWSGPAREWVSSFLAGDHAALLTRAQELEQLSSQQGDPLLSELPDYGAGDSWEVIRHNDRVSRAHERHAQVAMQAERVEHAQERREREISGPAIERPTPYTFRPAEIFNHTKGFEGEGPVHQASSSGRRALRARSAPPAPRPRVAFDELVLGQPATVKRRARFVKEFDDWLAEAGEPSRDVLVCDPAKFDRVLATYGQVLWDRESPQSYLPELLNAIRKLHPSIGGRLKGAWDVRTAWQLLEPGNNKAPVPEKLCRAAIAVAITWQWHELAALVMLAFEGALRPGDILGLQRHDLRFADEHGGGAVVTTCSSYCAMPKLRPCVVPDGNTCV